MLKRDQNRVTVLGGVTDDANAFVTQLRVDPITNRLKVTGSGVVTGSGSATQIAFWDSSSTIAGTSTFYWDNVNKFLGVQTNTPDADITIEEDTVGPYAGPVTATASETDSPTGSTYVIGDALIYKVYALFFRSGSVFYSNTLATTSTATITTDFNTVFVDWSAVTGAFGYLVVRDFNADGFASYRYVIADTNFYDYNAYNFTEWGGWFSSPPSPTPTSISSGRERFGYANNNDIFGINIGNDAFIGNALGIGTNPSDGFALDVFQPTTELSGDGGGFKGINAGAVRITKDTGGANLIGVNANLTIKDSHLVINNNNEDAQTMFSFAINNVPVGGARGDGPGNFNWQAKGYHAFYNAIGSFVDGAAAITCNVNSSGKQSVNIGGSAGSAAIGSNLLDVYGGTTIGSAFIGNDAPTDGLLVAGQMGSGVAVPTAQLHLKAGTDVAGTAPLKFNAGTLLATPESGTVEYDGINFYFTS